MHPNLQAVSALLGTFVGEGCGEYPTIKGFQYVEEVAFTDVGKPFLHYVQRTWTPDRANAMHTETGYLRVQPGGHLEMTLAQPTGQTELLEGRLEAGSDGLSLVFEESAVANSSTAKTVDRTRRVYRLVGDVLETSFDMAAVGEPMGRHLTSTLRRLD